MDLGATSVDWLIASYFNVQYGLGEDIDPTWYSSTDWEGITHIQLSGTLVLTGRVYPHTAQWYSGTDWEGIPTHSSVVL